MGQVKPPFTWQSLIALGGLSQPGQSFLLEDCGKTACCIYNELIANDKAWYDVIIFLVSSIIRGFVLVNAEGVMCITKENAKMTWERWTLTILNEWANWVNFPVLHQWQITIKTSRKIVINNKQEDDSPVSSKVLARLSIDF